MRSFLHFFGIIGIFTLLIGSTGLIAQSTLDTGGLKGRVMDEKGSPLPGAIIRAKGPQGQKVTETDGAGNYNIAFMTPGNYEVTVTMDGYSTQVQPGIVIAVKQLITQSFKLAVGTETIIVRAGRNIDTSSNTAVTKIDLAEAVNVFTADRSFAGAFDFASGVNTASGVSGAGNVSISGASGLENQYLIGGVNITNSGYGGIGAYDSVHGGQGTGVTTEFLEFLDIREGGFDAEDGGALGGVISANIKSGSNDFKGGVFAYYSPTSLDGAGTTFSRAGGIIYTNGVSNLDMGFSLGGPIVKDRLFFFAAYNPYWKKEGRRFDISQSDLAKDMIVAPNANQEYDLGNNRVDNYAFHLTWVITDKHKLDFIAFGSPQTVSGIRREIGRRVNPSDDPGVTMLPTPGGIPDTDSVAGSRGGEKIVDRSFSLKYFGSIAPWFNVEAQASYHQSQIIETLTAASDVYAFSDIRRTQVYNAQVRNAGLPGVPQPIVSPSQYTFGGVGFHQGGSNDENLELVLKVINNFNFMGSHEMKWGVDYANIKFRENVIYSGPRDDQGAELHLDLLGANQDSFVRLRTGTSPQMRCLSINPLRIAFLGACSGVKYRVNRGNFNPATPNTINKELSLFVQDKWAIRTLILNLGVRYTREKVGNPSSYRMTSTQSGNALVDGSGNAVGTTDLDCVNAFYDTLPPGGTPIPANCYPGGRGNFVGSTYAFKGEFAPRLGFSWDVLGNGKSKLYGGWGRLFERVPNDLAVRSFGNEFGISAVDFNNPDLTSQRTGFAPFVFGGTPTRVAKNTRLPYKTDMLLGYEFELAPRLTMNIKASYRTQGRLLEDTQAAPIEAIENYYYGGFFRGSGGTCINCAPGQTLPFPGEGYASFGEYVLANVSENAPATYRELDQFGAFVRNSPVTFGTPGNKYKALSLTIDKQPGEGEHVHVHATYRYSQLTGNYEGLFRNDNGQDDPNISSLYDFPLSTLTRSQYFDGRLNTDVPHALLINTAYDDFLIKNLSAALTFKWSTGTLRTPMLAHPIYQNAGEIPGINPKYYEIDFNADGNSDFSIMKSYTAVERGYGGNNISAATWDLKFAYHWILGKSSFDFSLLVNNLFNFNQVTAFDQNVQSQAGIDNPFYGLPKSAHYPRNIRLGLRWSF